MNSYADTGFVVTLYKEEATSASAAALMVGQTTGIGMSQLGELEFRNALHLAVFRGELTAADATSLQTLFQEDVANGIFIITPVPASTLFAKAMELADRHSPGLGTRSLDLLHVAAALLLQVDTFLSFDERQRQAARAEGMKVKP
jgi:hypothetical protein